MFRSIKMRRLILLFTCMIISVILSYQVSSETIVTDSLVSYWTFDGDDIKDRIAEDVWGENDAEIKGNPILVDAYQNHGLKFDGIDDYVVLRDAGNFGTHLGSFTFEVWLKTSEKSHWRAIYKIIERPCRMTDKGSGILINADYNPPERGIHTKKDRILIQRQRMNGGNGCGGGRSTLLRNPIADGNWHHLVYVQEGKIKDLSGVEKKLTALYIDSIPVMKWVYRESNPDGNIPYTLPVFLGAVNNKGLAHSCFRGIFDEVRVYNRGLSQDEVTQNYKSSNGLAVEHTDKLSTVWGALKKK